MKRMLSGGRLTDAQVKCAHEWATRNGMAYCACGMAALAVVVSAEDVAAARRVLFGKEDA